MSSISRDEHGTTMISTLIGMALGVMILSGFMAFYANANAHVMTTVERASTQAELVTAANRISRDIDESVSIVELTPTVLELHQGTTLVRWTVTTDGRLVSQRTEADSPAWGTVTPHTVARDVDPGVFSPSTTDEGLVHISLTAGYGQQIATAASISR